jgi:archaellum component FlaC
MLKNRKDTLAKAVKHHYKKQEIFLLEAQKNIERRKNNLEKISTKLGGLVKNNTQSEHKLERLEEEFLNINRSYDSPFH